MIKKKNKIKKNIIWQLVPTAFSCVLYKYPFYELPVLFLNINFK